MVKTVYDRITFEMVEREFLLGFDELERKDGLMRIQTNIPKFVNKFKDLLWSGTIRINPDTEQITEIDGWVKDCSFSVTKKRVLSDEERAKLSELAKKNFNK